MYITSFSYNVLSRARNTVSTVFWLLSAITLVEWVLWNAEAVPSVSCQRSKCQGRLTFCDIYLKHKEERVSTVASTVTGSDN